MERMADALADTSRGGVSLKALGYVNVGLDDGWQDCGKGVNGSFHDGDGKPLINSKKFSDMAGMVAHIHSRGLRAGWYINNCMCAERNFSDPAFIETVYRGSVAALHSLQFDGIKLDSCSMFNNLTKCFNSGGTRTLVGRCLCSPDQRSTPSCERGGADQRERAADAD